MTDETEMTGVAHVLGRRMQSEQAGVAQDSVSRHDEDFRRLHDDLAKLREELAVRNAELDLLRTELEFVRVLSGRRRDAAGYSLSPLISRQSRVQSAAALMEYMLLAAWRKLPKARADAAQLSAIRDSGLFDHDWYLKRYPDVAKSGIDPLHHYFKFGAWEGRDPNPLFDTDWYRSTYPDVAAGAMTPLGHFVCVGAARGYDPNPLFHTGWYVANNPDTAAARVNPLRHYIEHAGEDGRNPNPLFDSAWYLKENPDVAAAGENPLSHYIHCGIGELRDPHPLFDTEWYLDRYENVAATGMDALEHYLTIGAFEGCRPAPVVRDGAKRQQRKRPPRGAGVGRLADWLAADFGLITDGQATSTASLTSVDVLNWQLRIRRRPPLVPGFDGQIGVFVHLFYEELAEEIASQLLAIPFPFKVYISTNSHEKKTAIEAAFGRWGLEPVIKVLPNRGWDIAAFLVGFAEEVRSHDICLKLHGKRSRHNSRDQGARWRQHLLSGLLGTPRNISFIVDTFSARPDLGVLMTPHWKGIRQGVNVIGVNYLPMRALLARVGLSISPEQPIEFPSGSMFWFRSAALAPLLDLGLTWRDFNECRTRSRDATIAHGIERCILFFATRAGFKWAFLPERWASRNWRRPHKSWRLQILPDGERERRR